MYNLFGELVYCGLLIREVKANSVGAIKAEMILIHTFLGFGKLMRVKRKKCMNFIIRNSANVTMAKRRKWEPFVKAELYF